MHRWRDEQELFALSFVLGVKESGKCGEKKAGKNG
jgi:hypothetical protein